MILFFVLSCFVNCDENGYPYLSEAEVASYVDDMQCKDVPLQCWADGLDTE